jgi:DegV family protein with EDD domain
MTRELAQSLNVKIISMNYTVASLQFKESYNDNNGYFEDLIFKNAGLCKTAHVSISDFLNIFKNLTDKGCNVICILISSKLSGTYSSACVAAKEINSDKIAVIDSLSAAGGMFFLIKKAVEFINSDIPFNMIPSKLEELRDNIGVAFSVDDMSFLRLSGRLGIVPRSVGTILNNRPILLCRDGAVVSKGLARGRKEQIKELADLVPNNSKDVIIHYLDDEKYINALLDEIKKKLPEVLISVNKLGPVLGIHLGPGVIGVSWLRE